LPVIAVESETTRLSLQIPADLHTRLEEYARYFRFASGGRKPLSMNHLVLGLLENRLTNDTSFQKWRTEHRNGAENGEPPFAEAKTGTRQ
jgi:hypothetical protein